jgi:DNA-binding NarL/FixJ family response regulator
MIRIIIVDDHTIVRKGIQQLLEDTEDIRIQGEAHNAAEMFKKLEKENFDLILLDISLPGRSGVEALKQLKELHPDIPVLILSMYPEDQYALRVMKAGASGYLTKESAPDELVQAIRTVSKGKKYISTSLAEALADHINGYSEKPGYKKLSDREFEVLKRIGSGQTLTEIAEELSLSVKTISTYRSRILNKLDLKNNSDIVRYTLKNQLLDI